MAKTCHYCGKIGKHWLQITHLLGKETSNQAKQSIYNRSKVGWKKNTPKSCSSASSVSLFLCVSICIPARHSYSLPRSFLAIFYKYDSRPTLAIICQLVIASGYRRWDLIHRSERNHLITLMKSAHKLEEDLKIQLQWLCSKN